MYIILASVLRTPSKAFVLARNPMTPYLLYGYRWRTYVCIMLFLVISLKYNYFYLSIKLSYKKVSMLK